MNKCPKCLNSFTEKTKFCKICGCNLQEELIEKPTCPKCNTVFGSDIKFCVNDGTKLVHPDKLIPKCVVCKKAYTNGAKFCPNDGGQIKLDDEYIQKTPPVVASVNESIKNENNETTPYSRPVTNQYIKNEKYNKAPLGKRFLAYLLDGFIVLLFCIPSIILIFDAAVNIFNYGFNSVYDGYGASKLVWGLILLIVPVIYGLIKDGLGNGQSYGKRALDLMVINVNTNEPCSKTNSVGRNIVFNLVQIIPYVGWIIEYVMVLANQEGRKISDLVAGTQVIDLHAYKSNSDSY